MHIGEYNIINEDDTSIRGLCGFNGLFWDLDCLPVICCTIINGNVTGKIYGLRYAFMVDVHV